MGKKTRKSIEKLTQVVAAAHEESKKHSEELAERVISALENQAEASRELNATLETYLGRLSAGAAAQGTPEDAPQPDAPEPEASAEEAPAVRVDAEGNVIGADEPIETGEGENGSPEATGAAERKARDLGVDLASVSGTGSGGRITVADVERAAGV